MLNPVPVYALLFVGFLGFFVCTSYMRKRNEIMPWLGILRVKPGKHQREAVTGIVLIEKRFAVGNAMAIAKVSKDLRQSTKATFYRNNVQWDCRIGDIIIHPDYAENVLNTIALVILNCSFGESYWDPIKWKDGLVIKKKTFFSFSFTDENGNIKQVVNRMEIVNNSDCVDFYEREKLDFKSLWPKHYTCFRDVNAKGQCVYDTGMAMAVYSGGSWILTGISVQGPGCSLPSRFIDLLPYAAWIKTQLIASKCRAHSFRRSNYDQGMEEPFEDLDSVLLEKINDTTIVMRPTLADVKEQVYGQCDKKDGVLMYREFGTIKAPGHTPTGVYALSIYDIFFWPFTCVMVTMICEKRSKTRFWFDTGFHQDDVDDYVRIIPVLKRNETKAPKILFAKDSYAKYRMRLTMNLDFKFQFVNEAKLEIEFYGYNDTKPGGIFQPFMEPSLNNNPAGRSEQVPSLRRKGLADADGIAKNDQAERSIPEDNDSFFYP